MKLDYGTAVVVSVRVNTGETSQKSDSNFTQQDRSIRLVVGWFGKAAATATTRAEPPSSNPLAMQMAWQLLLFKSVSDSARPDRQPCKRATANSIPASLAWLHYPPSTHHGMQSHQCGWEQRYPYGYRYPYHTNASVTAPLQFQCHLACTAVAWTLPYGLISSDFVVGGCCSCSLRRATIAVSPVEIVALCVGLREHTDEESCECEGCVIIDPRNRRVQPNPLAALIVNLCLF